MMFRCCRRGGGKAKEEKDWISSSGDNANDEMKRGWQK